MRLERSICFERRVCGQKSVPTNGREERIGGGRYVGLSYSARVEYSNRYANDLP
jgi:hypothetical protein